ncbi:MAG: N-acetylmuramoyl-L-alanine amidase family protein [Clostridiales bacterium]|nr:N-acetylmuramoyl-L-alanine amidase family protein [Clostridiales bacterium]
MTKYAARMMISALIILLLTAFPVRAGSTENTNQNTDQNTDQNPAQAIRPRLVMQLTYDGAVHTYDAETVSLYVNGSAVQSFDGDMPSIILNDRLYLPVRDIFEMLGAELTWNEQLQTVYISYEDKLVAIRDGSPYINDDGRIIPIQLPPRNVNGRLMAPISLIADVFGFSVNWDDKTRIAAVNNGRSIAVLNSEPDPVLFTATPEPPVRTETPVGTVTAIDENVDAGPQTLELSMDANPEKLPAQELPKTEITAVEFDPGNPRAFYIRASGPISRVEKFLLYDNRLVLDIYNAEKIVPETEIFASESGGGAGFLSKVRIGQNQITPEMITRVVFDLTEPVSYSVAFADDRKTLAVTLLQNRLGTVSFRSDGNADYIHITGDKAPVVNVFPQTVEGALIIDIPLGIAERPQSAQVQGVFAASYSLEQFSPAMARIVVDTKEAAAYSVAYEDGGTTVKLTRPTYQNITYESAQSRMTIPKTSGLDINAIVQNDEYLNYRYEFILPGDYSAILGQGDYIIKDRYINFVNITTTEGKTRITFHEQQVMAFAITEDAENIYIHSMLPRDMYNRIVVIDPGHGGTSPGTIHNGITEKEYDLDIAKRTQKLLEAAGIKVYMTRTGDTGPTLEERAAFANGLGDLFISMHLNAVEEGYGASTSGTEVYYYPHANDAAIGYTSKEVAKIAVDNIVAALGSKNRDAKQNDYRVLVLTEIPAILCEYGFITNPAEASKLKTEDYRQKAAQGTVNGVMEMFRSYVPKR